MLSIVSKLKSYSDLVHLKPATETDIFKAETQLSVKFAADYFEYLTEFGVAAANGHELTGICASSRLDVVSVTKAQRITFPKAPKNWYVIEEAHIDGIVVWQDENGSIYQSEPNIIPEEIAASLTEYVSY